MEIVRRIRSAVPLLALVVVLLAACSTPSDILSPGPTTYWTGRFLYEGGLDWASRRGLSAAQYQDDVDAYADRGYLVVDVDVRSDGGGLAYAFIAHENPDGRDWAAHHDLTSSAYHDLWEAYRAQGMRPLDVEGYLLDGQLRFAGVWIENVEGLAWSSARQLTGAEYGAYFEARRAEGKRPVDIEAYDAPEGRRYAAIWYDDVDGVPWSQLRDLDRSGYEQEVEARADDGYLLIDYERYAGATGPLFAAIWERPADRPAFQIRTGRTPTAYANLWRTYLDMGYRLADFESSDAPRGDLHAGIWIENADRFRYARKEALDADIETYRTANDIPGISVAIVRDGDLLYRRGFGEGDAAGGEVAHGGTVYGAASVSKVIGGTLATLLEDANALRDGTPIALDLSDPTSDYLDDLPSHHTHDVDQLAAHLGCIGHYDSTPSIANQTTHYATALAAAESIWDAALVQGCTIGSTRSYSTPAFTLLGAVLEEAAGRPIDQLLESELFAPHGLSSMRVAFAGPSLIPDDDRAVPYDDAGDPSSYADSSWKVLGGGIETDVVDLARFGWKVLDGQIVDAGTRDDRLWSPVDASCSGPGSGTCRNGVAWVLRTRSGRPVAEHDGGWSGSRSYLRVYRDDGLVIAVLSNRRGHDPSGLIETLASTVLAP